MVEQVTKLSWIPNISKKNSLRDSINAIMYIVKTGCQWHWSEDP